MGGKSLSRPDEIRSHGRGVAGSVATPWPGIVKKMEGLDKSCALMEELHDGKCRITCFSSFYPFKRSTSFTFL